MILGLLAELPGQKSLLPVVVVRALEAVQKLELATLPTGRYDIEGDAIFCLVQDLNLRSLEDSQAEAHVEHADIQLPLSASERYGFALPQAGLAMSENYLSEKDLAFYATPANEFFMDLQPGAYVVFLPGELHRPGLIIQEKITLRKIVIKIHRRLLNLPEA